jgi:hypothetical protein
VELEVGSDFWDNSILARREETVSSCTLEVPGAPLAMLLAKAGQPVTALVVDVEGAERFLDPTTLPNSIRTILIEFHPKILGARETYNLIARLIQSGFYVAKENGGTFAFLKEAQPQAVPMPGRTTARDRDLAAMAT